VAGREAVARIEHPLDPAKFRDPHLTAKRERRATVALKRLRTLWFNTGTLCNLTCRNCYIESSPRNDSLVYLSAAEVSEYLDEIERNALGTEEIGFTGGEPFMNPQFPAMLEDALRRGYRALVLTNAMRPMMKMAAPLLTLTERYSQCLMVRVSLDHYSQSLHELERGPEAGARPSPGSSGSSKMVSSCTWPVGGFPASPRPYCGLAMIDCSANTRYRSMRAIPSSWCCFPRWTRPKMCRRSQPRVGGFSECPPTR
jgi:hypothetical protein